MKQIWQALRDSLCHLVYPSKCLHCHDLMSPESSLLCSACASLLELINPAERCPTCFEVRQPYEHVHCSACQESSTALYQIGAAFDYLGPAATLVKKLKYANQPHLARGLAAFLTAQFDQLNWPLPDALVPVPLSFAHWFDRGYNQSTLIANEMAHYLDIPVWHPLKRRSGDFSQAGLTLTQRQLMDGLSFQLKKNHSLQGKTVLLIDDVLTSGTTLNKCAECLVEGSPACIYALTVCKAI